MDASNAFNCVHRSHLLAAAARAAPPHLVPWLSTLYGAPLPLLVRGSNDARISSTRGVQQGCNFGTLLFALGIQDIVSQLPDLWLNHWYADDGILLGPTGAVERALLMLESSFAAIGLTLNRGKCITWGPGALLPERAQLSLSSTRQVPFTPGSGVVVLGTPVYHPGGEGLPLGLLADKSG